MNSGPTEADWRQALAEVQSREFDIRLSVVSGLASFIRAADQLQSVRVLNRALMDSREAREEVFGRLNDLSNLAVDRRYLHPYDSALTILLWLTISSSLDYGLMSAEVVDRAPQCWYAKKLSRKVLMPTPAPKTNGETGISNRDISVSNNSTTEFRTTMNPSILPRHFLNLASVTATAGGANTVFEG